MNRTLLTAGVWTLGFLLALPGGRLRADSADKDTARLVVQMIPQFHLSRSAIDDGISAKLVDKMLKNLDPRKLYFLQSDIDTFNAQRSQLDDQLKTGNVDFAYQVFAKYIEQLKAQIEKAQVLIDSPQDFTAPDTMVVDGDDETWAKNSAELDDRWRRWIKYELLQDRVNDKPEAETKDRLHKKYRNSLRNVTQLDKVDQLEIYLTALTECFDPHSSYMTPRSWEDFEIQMKLSLDGIGAALKGDDGYTVVAEIVPGGAAEKDGRLKVGDKIIGIGQSEGEIEDIFGIKLSNVVRKIRGEKGTQVRLRVQSANGDINVIDMLRQKIELKEQEVKGEVIDATTRIGRAGRIGFLSLPSFYRDFEGAQIGGEFKSAAVDVAKELEKLTREGIDGLVIDLRGNGGGSLAEAVEISGHFIDEGPVVQVKDPGGKVKSLDDDVSGVLYNGPVVVICNRLSASASEIFAGVIKDFNRGIVIGDMTTHGKGTVQNLMEVSAREPFRIFTGKDRGKLKLTIQQFYRVNGDSTQNFGVRSDVVLPSLLDHLDQGEAFLDNALPFDRISEATHARGRFVSNELVAALQKNSETRTAKDPEFQKTVQVITKYLEKKNRKSVNLIETEMRAEREANKALESNDPANEGKTDEEIDASRRNGPIFPDEYYNDEILNITLDYVAGLKGQTTVQK